MKISLFMFQLAYQHIRIHYYRIFPCIFNQIKIYMYIEKIKKLLKFVFLKLSSFTFDF